MTNINQQLVAGLMAAGIVLNSSTIPLLPDIEKEISKIIFPTITMAVLATAYASHPELTDATPNITASNTYVYDGVMAANFLAFGTKVKISGLFGDKIFTVEDRMNRRFNNAKPPRVDIWFPTLAQAKKFGVKNLEIEILD